MKHSFTIYYLLLSLLFYATRISAQEPTGTESNDETDLLEDAVENETNLESGYESFAENLEFLRAHQINLNKTNYEELRSSGIFTELQIRDLLQHITLYGELISVHELQTIPSFQPDDIEKILPYITTGNNDDSNIPLVKQLYTGKYQYFLRFSRTLEEQEGFSGDTTISNPYLGDSYRIYTRLKYNFNNQLYYGVTAEKDPGEELFGESQPAGFDYYSFHFLKKSKGFFKTIAVGDYAINIGQGLTMWSGFGLGKSIYPIAIKRTSNILDSYSSVNENRFLRGAAVSVGNKNFSITPFISYKYIDANITGLDTVAEEVTEVSSFQSSGLHRTETELADKDA
ncbi:MAG: hypothetical protein H7X71_04045, partial [Chitinophagales bacterium]|nr:hypothetical protein [Chitinophagales bacterium]